MEGERNDRTRKRDSQNVSRASGLVRMSLMVPMPFENWALGKRQAWNPLRLMTLFCCVMTVLNGCGSKDQPADQPTSNSNQNLGGAPAAPHPFNQVEYTYTQSSASFAALWLQAKTRTVRIALLGDSQETSPGGKGYVYMPRLNYEAWRRFGNVPESFVAGYGSYGDGAPWGDWLLRGAAAAPGATPTRILPARQLPNISAAAHSAAAGDRNINGQWYGQLTILHQDAASIAPEALVSTGTDYFCTGGSVRAEIFAASYPGSGEVHYIARPIDTNTANYYAVPSAEGTSTMGLDAVDYAIKSVTTPPLPYAGHRYLQLELLGSDDAALTDIIGVRFISDQCPRGIVIQGLSAGGLSAKDFIEKYGEAGDLFRAMGFDAAILHFGANDIGQGASAATFRADTETLIARIRAWTKDSNFPVILMSDPYRKGLTPAMEEEYDRYPGAQRAIAASDPHVLLVNSRRLMDDRGWRADRPDRLAELLEDDVHYTPRGAIDLAEAEMGELLGH